MNNKAKSIEVRRTPWYFRLSTFASLVACALALTVCVRAWVEWESSLKLAKKVEQLKREGLPYDADSLAAWYNQRTTVGNISQWRELACLVSSGPIVEQLRFYEQAKWKASGDEPLNNQFVSLVLHAQPILKKLKALPTPDLPLRNVGQFDGADTLLTGMQGSREMLSLVMIDFQYAIARGEKQRAMDAILLMEKCVKIDDLPFCPGACYLTLGQQFSIYRGICDSLQNDLWGTEELKTLLAEHTHPLNLPERWRSGTDGFGAILTGGHRKFLPTSFQSFAINSYLVCLQLPSIRNGMFDELQKIRSLADQGVQGLVERCRQFDTAMEEDHRRNLVYALLMSQTLSLAMEPQAKLFLRIETMRRLTRTSIALKIFRIEEGKWPDKLSELEKYGLHQREWESPSGTVFSYLQKDHGQSIMLSAQAEMDKYLDVVANANRPPEYEVQIRANDGGKNRSE